MEIKQEKEMDDRAFEINYDKILVLDFGSQYTHLILRRLREMDVYSELKRCDISISEIKNLNVKGVILSGGPSSVYEENSPHASSDFWDFIEINKIPALGICYGLQEMMHVFGGRVEKGKFREFGEANLQIIKPLNGIKKENCCEVDVLFKGLPFDKSPRVWMSHGDKVTLLADGFEVIAMSENSEYAAVRHVEKLLWGVQFHPEVTHTLHGFQILKNFVLNICGAKQNWNIETFLSTKIERIQQIVKDNYVIGALSGGVDSTVAAALLHKALGNKFYGFLIDTGLLRANEAEEVIKRLKTEIPGLQISCIDASKIFLEKLKSVVEPETKRKIIGELFIDEFEKAVEEYNIPVDGTFLLQGTLYPDVIESVSYKGPSHTIKTHHNVGGLPKKMKLKLLEPLRELFKDEVRELGKKLGLNSATVSRHPFPGPGLAIRILGEITNERLDILRKADKIYIEEIEKNGHYEKISQAFVVLLPEAKSVGVMGDTRTYEMTCILRAVHTEDFMTADWYKFPHDILNKISNRIINEVSGINRVCYDVSSKPPSTIEWE